MILGNRLRAFGMRCGDVSSVTGLKLPKSNALDLEVRCSIHLSYSRAPGKILGSKNLHESRNDDKPAGNPAVTVSVTVFPANMPLTSLLPAEPCRR